LFLDEILESLDEDRQDLAWKVLERLTKRYQQIFVVTHVERFKDRAIAPISLEA
jgi:DNA repair exonuclease SbcCD ATPase subunit